MENPTDILVFKTNIRTEKDIDCIKELLDGNDLIHDWNVDTDDVDCVLRIVSGKVSTHQIIYIITENGFHCEELL